jgi:sensor domain CHASE-containing protein
MKSVKSGEDIYKATEDLITELKSRNLPNLAAVLSHRLHQVAWTTRSELFEELRDVLMQGLNSQRESMADDLKSRIQLLLQAISQFSKAVGNE